MSARTWLYKGFGVVCVGLAVVGAVVRRHGGSITVESKLGEGTTFNLWLPIAQDA